MSIPNYLQRAQYRRKAAADAARRAEDANPWNRASRRAREFHLPPSCYLIMDALQERARKLGKEAGAKGLPVLIGYGDGTPAEQACRNRSPVQRPRHPAETTLSQLTGLSRRTLMRGLKILDQLGLMNRHRMYGEKVAELKEQEYECKSRISGVIRGMHSHFIGRGGCGPGGVGNANAYHPDGVDPPDSALPPAPRPRSEGSPGLGTRGTYGALWEHHEAQRRLGREHDRGP
jgi:hypothetical protein